MLLKRDVLDGVVAGRITLVFRCWKRPTVKSGGTLRTAAGVLEIQSVDVVDEKAITQQDARRAGYSARADLLADLRSRSDGLFYRIALRHLGEDPRIELRQQDELSDDDFEKLRSKLARMDARSRHGVWTSATLNLISEKPSTLAADLAESIGRDKRSFKADVRKLKELGLTESLKVGYRLSPRGKALLQHFTSARP